MAPCKPRDIVAGQNPMHFFGGAMIYESLPPPPGKSFLIRATFKALGPPDERTAAKLGRFPVEHFHAFQMETFKVEQGQLTLVVNGKLRVVGPEEGEIDIPAGDIHQFGPTPGATEDLIVVVCAEDKGEKYQLDGPFFENWSSYQTEALKYGYELDYLQVLSMWDAGDCVLPLPKWVPFGKKLAYWRGVVLGRWLGGLLGYQPFFPEWTSDWNACCDKMEQSIFQRRFAKRHAATKKTD